MLYVPGTAVCGQTSEALICEELSSKRQLHSRHVAHAHLLCPRCNILAVCFLFHLWLLMLITLLLLLSCCHVQVRTRHHIWAALCSCSSIKTSHQGLDRLPKLYIVPCQGSNGSWISTWTLSIVLWRCNFQEVMLLTAVTASGHILISNRWLGRVTRVFRTL